MQEEVWSSDESESESESVSESHTASPPIQHFYIFALLWQFTFKISNAAVTTLLRFMKYFIKALGLAFDNNDLLNVADSIPVGLQTVYKHLGISGNDFVPYVVCPSCHSVYRFEDCIVKLPFGKSESMLPC